MIENKALLPGKTLFGPFVHESVRDDAWSHARHHSFIVSHALGAAMAAVTVPLYWLVNGTIDAVVVAALCWMTTPAAVAYFLMRTGALQAAHFMSSSILAVLIGAVAVQTGGLSSFLIFWMLVVPVEAAMSGSRRVVVFSLLLSFCVIAALGFAEHAQWLPASLVPDVQRKAVMAVGLVSALAYIGMLAATIDHLYGKSEEAVQDSAQRYQLLAENATDMITRHETNGDVSFVSGAANRLVSCEPQALLGRGYVGLIRPEDRQAYVSALVTAAETGEPASAEFRLSNEAAGSATGQAYKWVELNCRPIINGSDVEGPLQLVAVSRDITHRKEQQEELRKARDLAEQASSAKTVFLANMSHELRTPLNSVIGFAEILERDFIAGGTAPAHGEYAALIRQSGEHLLGVVNDLLDMSKIEAGQMSLCFDSVELNEIVSYCEQSVSASADASGVELVLDLEQDGIDLEADQRACRQIMLNLLSNAIKFSDAGGRVVIRTISDGRTARVSVRDQGAGIAPELLGRLGQPFLQADGAYSKGHEGAGLGLSIVKGLIRLHSGWIDIESEENSGTCITVSLPVRQSGEAEAAQDVCDAAAEREALEITA